MSGCHASGKNVGMGVESFKFKKGPDLCHSHARARLPNLTVARLLKMRKFAEERSWPAAVPQPAPNAANTVAFEVLKLRCVPSAPHKGMRYAIPKFCQVCPGASQSRTVG